MLKNIAEMLSEMPDYNSRRAKIARGQYKYERNYINLFKKMLWQLKK
jgi:hypothetical protein